MPPVVVFVVYLKHMRKAYYLLILFQVYQMCKRVVFND